MFKLMHVKLKDKRLNKIWFALSPTGKKQNFEQLIQFLRSSNQAYELHSTLKQADQLYVSNLEAKLQVLVKVSLLFILFILFPIYFHDLFIFCLLLMIDY